MQANKAYLIRKLCLSLELAVLKLKKMNSGIERIVNINRGGHEGRKNMA